MKLINQGNLTPVAVVLGEVDLPLISAFNGSTIGSAASQHYPGQIATWISFPKENDMLAFAHELDLENSMIKEKVS